MSGNYKWLIVYINYDPIKRRALHLKMILSYLFFHKIYFSTVIPTTSSEVEKGWWGTKQHNTKGNLCSQPNSACKFNELNIQLQRRKRKRKKQKEQTDTECIRETEPW